MHNQLYNLTHLGAAKQTSALSSSLFLLQFLGAELWIYVYHAVFDCREFSFDGIVDTLGDGVGFGEGFVAVGLDDDVEVDFGSEEAGFHPADAVYAFGVLDDDEHLFHGFDITGVVDHFIYGVFEDVVGCFKDKDADHNAGYGIHDGEAEAGEEDTDQGADGGKGIASVMPCICF